MIVKFGKEEAAGSEYDAQVTAAVEKGKRRWGVDVLLMVDEVEPDDE